MGACLILQHFTCKRGVHPLTPFIQEFHLQTRTIWYGMAILNARVVGVRTQKNSPGIQEIQLRNIAATAASYTR